MHKLKSNYISLTSNERLYCCDLPIIGLTGGIATGKSTASKYLRGLDIPLIDADQLIHSIYAEDETLQFVSQIAPEAVKTGSINFGLLRDIFFQNKELKSNLEGFLYSRMPQKFLQTIDEVVKSPFQYVVYDVPLLFEKQLTQKLDINILIYAPSSVQKERLKKRDDQSDEQVEAILAQQISIEKKREMAQFCIENTSDIEGLNRKIHTLFEKLTTQ